MISISHVVGGSRPPNGSDVLGVTFEILSLFVCPRFLMRNFPRTLYEHLPSGELYWRLLCFFSPFLMDSDRN